MLSYLFLVLGLAAAAGGWIWRRKEHRAAAAADRPPKVWPSVVCIVGLWVFINVLAGVLWPEAERRAVTIGTSAAGRLQIGSFTLSPSLIVCWILLLVVVILCLLIRFVLVPRMQDIPHGLQVVLEGTVRFFSKHAHALFVLAVAAGLWASIGILANMLCPNAEKRSFGVELFAARLEGITVLGAPLSSTVLLSWIVMLVVVVLCLLIRFLVVPRMKDVPTGAQAVLETAVDFVAKFTNDTGGELGENLCAYIFSLGLFMVGCAMVELFGYRAPTSDITVTFSLALVTFFLINFYGIRQKGVVGRLKSFAAASPIAAPFKFISDLAVPVSMACRLFGNMLAGMIVMDLLYTVLKAFSFGIPSVLGLYFNLFHPFIQVYIFATLTLTFIKEAVE